MKTRFSIREALEMLLLVCALGCLALVCQPLNVFAGTTRRPQDATPQANAQKPAAPQGPEAMAGKTAGEYYKNIQILKDIPANQLIPSMHYISAALGTECEFCHVRGDFSKDDKPEKKTARRMMTMMFAINKDNFNGRLQVGCFTCHHAATHPAAMPMLPETASTMPGAMGGMQGNQQGPGGMGATAPSGPSASDILQKYLQALGGQDAIAKVTTLSEQGTVEIPGRGPGAAPSQATMETYRKAPDKALAILHQQNRQVTEGFDGSAAWEQRGTSVTDETGDDLTRVKEWAEFIPGLSLATNTRARVAGTEKIGDHDAYRVVAFQAGGAVQYYFDTQSGLLLRISTRIMTPLGPLPLDTDYDDYRDVSGVKVPFTIRMVRMEGATTYKWSQVQANTPLEDSRFAKPASSAAHFESPGNQPTFATR